MNKLRTIIFYLSIFITFFFFFSCSDENNFSPDPNELYERGDLIEISYKGIYTPAQIQNVLSNENIQINTNLKYNVKVYSVVYQTINFKGQKSVASGAIYVPQTNDEISTFSFQHGTQTKRAKVASNYYEALPEAMVGLIGASTGFYSLVPDYLGLGKSELLHPYMMKFNSINIIDMIKASKLFAADNQININDKLFISGYSEGGYLTLALHKELEENYNNQFTVTACAPLGGCYDLNEIAKIIFSQDTYEWPYYIAYIFTAYDYYYNLNILDKMFPENIKNNLHSYFNGNYYDYEINAQLPVKMNQLIKPEFLQSYLNGNEKEMESAFRENLLLNWTPSSPITFIHGEADTAVPFSTALSAYNYFKTNSNSIVDIISFPGLDHETAGAVAIENAISWFQKF